MAIDTGGTFTDCVFVRDGKLQILKFLADAKRQKGDAFNLREFHDFLWLNGNVPIALQSWEYLGMKDDLQ